MVLGVAAGSALFVDYLADRARAGEGPVAFKPAIAESEDTLSSTTTASIAVAVEEVGPSRALPAALPPQAEPIQARLPDAAAIARVTAVGPEHAIELPTDDPTAAPILAYTDQEAADEGLSDRAAGEDGTTTAAVSPEKAEAAPRQRKQAAGEKPSQTSETEIASLPGVNVGGLAGFPSEDGDAESGSTVRTVVKPSSGSEISGTASVTSAVNMRSGPDKGASVLRVVPRGASVKVISCDGWCRISWDGRTGWVYKRFLSAVDRTGASAAKPDTSPPSPAPGRRIKSFRS